ncbi:apolipoprotein L2-like [Hippopotamus amphibius kiboko]|uniref:apolipoprotein L2-like n=1 Tax=Hippopotamus amphibius kiboko TaxID=575201 RepID=UPI002596536D|nr:apolipoprotein L2-like [Hippopotamus amphibius kiboko]XP_057598506.1 apolipoprotein L2-like [Hippopotamus amphibius kiboko]
MSSGNLGDRSDIEEFFEDVIECLWNIMSREELLHLLTKVLRRIEAEGSLCRENVDAGHEYLRKLKTDLNMKDQEMLPKDQLDRKRFLNKCPQVKQELEEQIGKLQAFADKVDKVHKDCTICNMAAASIGAVSGILTILGLVLAPVKAGVSLPLLATALGLRIASAVIRVSTSIVELFSTSRAETKARCLMSPGIDKWKMLLEVLKSNPQIVDTTNKFTEAMDRVKMNIQAMEMVTDSSGLPANMNISSSETIAMPGTQQAQGALKGPALTLTKVPIMFIASLVFAILVDVGSLVKEAMHLHEGAKAELADRLRQQAQKLERKLVELTQVDESLQYNLTRPPPEQCRDQGHEWGQRAEAPCERENEGEMKLMELGVRNLVFL